MPDWVRKILELGGLAEYLGESAYSRPVIAPRDFTEF
jgi:hypothetical protein